MCLLQNHSKILTGFCPRRRSENSNSELHLDPPSEPTSPQHGRAGHALEAGCGRAELGGRAGSLLDDSGAYPSLRCALRHVGGRRANQQRGHRCPLCTPPLRRYLRLDELFVRRCADPRAFALPMCSHEHVLTAFVPLSCRLSAASWTAYHPAAVVSHVGSFWSCEGPERAPGAEFRAAFASTIAFVQSGRIVCSCSVLQLSHVRVVR